MVDLIVVRVEGVCVSVEVESLKRFYLMGAMYGRHVPRQQRSLKRHHLAISLVTICSSFVLNTYVKLF